MRNLAWMLFVLAGIANASPLYNFKPVINSMPSPKFNNIYFQYEPGLVPVLELTESGWKVIHVTEVPSNARIIKHVAVLDDGILALYEPSSGSYEKLVRIPYDQDGYPDIKNLVTYSLPNHTSLDNVWSNSKGDRIAVKASEGQVTIYDFLQDSWIQVHTFPDELKVYTKLWFSDDNDIIVPAGGKILHYVADSNGYYNNAIEITLPIGSSFKAYSAAYDELTVAHAGEIWSISIKGGPNAEAVRLVNCADCYYRNVAYDLSGEYLAALSLNGQQVSLFSRDGTNSKLQQKCFFDLTEHTGIENRGLSYSALIANPNDGSEFWFDNLKLSLDCSEAKWVNSRKIGTPDLFEAEYLDGRHAITKSDYGAQIIEVLEPADVNLKATILPEWQGNPTKLKEVKPHPDGYLVASTKFPSAGSGYSSNMDIYIHLVSSDGSQVIDQNHIDIGDFSHFQGLHVISGGTLTVINVDGKIIYCGINDLVIDSCITLAIPYGAKVIASDEGGILFKYSGMVEYWSWSGEEFEIAHTWEIPNAGSSLDAITAPNNNGFIVWEERSLKHYILNVDSGEIKVNDTKESITKTPHWVGEDKLIAMPSRMFNLDYTDKYTLWHSISCCNKIYFDDVAITFGNRVMRAIESPLPKVRIKTLPEKMTATQFDAFSFEPEKYLVNYGNAKLEFYINNNSDPLVMDWEKPDAFKPSKSDVMSSDGGRSSFRLTEGNWQIHLPIDVQLTNVNEAPIASPVARQVMHIGEAYGGYLQHVFSDPDGDRMTFSVTGLPPGMIHDAGYITGQPSKLGIYTVIATATDPAGLTSSTKFVIEVIEEDSGGSLDWLWLSALGLLSLRLRNRRGLQRSS
ncbi:putative Ig domain-containing protein [Ferrimonas gelatinilytica]|uniref:Dystroglycan-type cadherin-like domain-containing protein n=1 Tax=Ferrimonas gelatinilytica TaxID=1255257 RepID=A0ABP9S963_9GAMM